MEINEDEVAIEIQEVEGILKRIEKDIKKIWFEVIKPYKMNIEKAQILDKIDSEDYIKFYEFMIRNNRPYNKAKTLLDYLHTL